MVYWRRRQPKPEARRLLGREPARLVPVDQGVANLWGHKQPVQSQIRDLRHFLRYAVDGGHRNTERADRSSHGHAGAAALGLCRDARKAVRTAGRVRKWHIASIRGSAALRSVFGAKRTLTEPRAYRERIYEYASSRSRRDRVACRWHAGSATRRGQPRVPCAIWPPRPAASSGWPSIRRGTGGWLPSEADASQAAS